MAVYVVQVLSMFSEKSSIATIKVREIGDKFVRRARNVPVILLLGDTANGT